jgi:site-specific DNA-methyltransferase (adenine-specific)/site-specific DNA-methyltransferase (cytosine-N4-specific)
VKKIIKQDFFNKNKCTLYLKSSEKLSEIENSSVNMVVTSPIYVNLRKNGVHPDKYVEWFMPFAKEIKRVLVKNGNFILNVNEVIVKGILHPYIDDLKHALRKIGLNQIAKPYIWYKTTAIPNRCSHRAIDRYEYCFWFSNGKGTFYRDNVRRPYADITVKRVENSDVISLSTRGEKGHKIFKKSKIDPRGALSHNVIELSPECNPKIKHSSPFPIGLPEWFIKAGTLEDDTVLDIFMGSGTTAVAALRNNRNVVGYEIDKEVFDFSVERIKKYFDNIIIK